MMLTRLIYPLALRERVSYRLRRFVSKANGKDISLSFDQSIRLDLSHTDIAHQNLILNGFHELGLTKRIKKLAKQGGLLVDVGANYGYFACLWAGETKANKVVAFEASPPNSVAIQHNSLKNSLTDQIRVESVAVGREVGRLRFALENAEGQTGWGGFSSAGSSTEVDVSVTTLDNYAQANKINEIDVLKIDVEGADTWVILGASTLIRQKKIKHIFFEINTTRMALLNVNPDEAETFLRQHGYAIEKLSADEIYAYVPEA